MSTNEDIVTNYSHGELLASIESALKKSGKTPETVTMTDLSPVDEFHIGGIEATDHFISQLNLSEQSSILDIGCGLGGSARYVAQKYKCDVAGIDLTDEYIHTGNVLSTWVHLNDQVTLSQGSALAMPYEDGSFDGAYMLHVGMNIQDKETLFSETRRVLKPGATFGIYDVMQLTDGVISYPVPWASDSSISFLASPDQYKATLRKVGFEVVSESIRGDFAIEFFNNLKTKLDSTGGPESLGIHTLMQSSAPLKLRNMVDNVRSGLIAPVEIIVRATDT